MHSIETIIVNNQQAGRTIAKQADRAQRVEEAAWKVINSKLLDEQQKAIFELREALVAVDVAKAVAFANSIGGVQPRPLSEILNPGE